MFGSKFLFRRETGYFERDRVGLLTLDLGSESFFSVWMIIKCLLALNSGHNFLIPSSVSETLSSSLSLPSEALAPQRLPPLSEAPTPLPQPAPSPPPPKAEGCSWLLWFWVQFSTALADPEGSREERLKLFCLGVQTSLYMWIFETEWDLSGENLLHGQSWATGDSPWNVSSLVWHSSDVFHLWILQDSCWAHPHRPPTWKLPSPFPRTLTSLWQTKLITGLISRVSSPRYSPLPPRSWWLERRQQRDASGLGLKWDHPSGEYHFEHSPFCFEPEPLSSIFSSESCSTLWLNRMTFAVFLVFSHLVAFSYTSLPVKTSLCQFGRQHVFYTFPRHPLISLLIYPLINPSIDSSINWSIHPSIYLSNQLPIYLSLQQIPSECLLWAPCWE